MAPKKSEPPKKKQKKIETTCNTITNNKGANPKSLAGNLSLKEKREKIAESVSHFRFNKKRCRMLTDSKEVPDSVRGVLYWMSRDQRVQDNWAFLFAQRLALKYKVPLHACFCLAPTFLGATIRHYMFMIKGLKEVEKECRQLDINFILLTGEAGIEIPQIVRKLEIGTLITDFAPLRVPLGWVEKVKNALPNSVPFCQVDAHNVVPCWHASDKQEVGARTIRKKIHNQLDEFLTEYPPLTKHPHPVDLIKPIDWDEAVKSLTVNTEVVEVDWAVPGTSSGLEVLDEFCEKRLKFYADKRNDPNSKAISNLSPWLHYGQISAQRCILTVKEHSSKYKEGVDSFVEEALVRRELSENFCFYNSNYDNINGASAWAKKTLEDHKKDKRGMLFNKQQLEDALTHDDLWNAAQLQMVKEGKMHGFMRMYWAKKILEWTKSPEEALEIAIYLNDKYQLDGRDPNGYVGCMWSICGIHDQGWAEREVFGKIRFMNYAGCKRKFDISAYVTRYGAKAYKYPGK